MNNGVWYRNGVAISLDASERIFAINGNTWRLLINSFIASDGGRYSCQNMGDTLDMVVSSGKAPQKHYFIVCVMNLRCLTVFFKASC